MPLKQCWAHSLDKPSAKLDSGNCLRVPETLEFCSEES